MLVVIFKLLDGVGNLCIPVNKAQLPVASTITAGTETITPDSAKLSVINFDTVLWRLKM